MLYNCQRSPKIDMSGIFRILWLCHFQNESIFLAIYYTVHWPHHSIDFFECIPFCQHSLWMSPTCFSFTVMNTVSRYVSKRKFSSFDNQGQGKIGKWSNPKRGNNWQILQNLSSNWFFRQRVTVQFYRLKILVVNKVDSNWTHSKIWNDHLDLSNGMPFKTLLL